MFFVLSKTLGVIALPTNFLMVIGILGVILLAMRFAALGGKLMVAAIAGLAICGFSPLGNLVLLPLSERFPAWRDTGRAPEGIVILGGSINPELTVARGAPEINSSAERMTTAAMLARRYPNAKIVLSGGNSNPFNPVFQQTAR